MANQNSHHTSASVAQWMADKLLKDGELYQNEAVNEIDELFGEEFVYQNENDNLAISRAVLKEFRNLTQNTAIWERGGFYWRLREADDPPGKRQADS